MAEIRLNIDGRECAGFEGQTILDIARASGIEIPTLCHDDRVKMYGACGICVVEPEGGGKLLRACSTLASNGMILNTGSERVLSSRRTALELLLSDHTGDCRPPCLLACPGQTDCQGYVGLIARGEYREAVKLIKDKIPLPSSIGRVCPHPCETECRRHMVEEPISIAALKSFAGDMDMASESLYLPECAPDTGKRVAVIGGGPGGLTAAYFLRIAGHAVTVYDMMPKLGGMLRYGIPEYRLPKRVLDREIDAVLSLGVKAEMNVRIGRDVTLEYLRREYDAVIIAVGAWTSTRLRCPGEELEGVIGGIDFLRAVAEGGEVLTGSRVAIVGGGNTAMDACRTAVRLGAEKVYNIYRRTKAEMPAEQVEIEEAEEEGVIFRNLTNPIEVVGENGRVRAMRLQIMELGEPDASGRRAPVPVEGAEETIELDTVIVAIGQGVDASGLEGVELTRWRTVAASEDTFLTSVSGVFAIGDATNNGADIAITAIGEAKKAVRAVCAYLDGESMEFKTPYLVKSSPTKDMFSDREKVPREHAAHRPPDVRRRDFLEIGSGYTEEQARAEGARCLECGCHDYFECKLLDYANRYDAAPSKFEGETHNRQYPDNHPFIHQNPDKCILCGQCVRVCDEAVGATALGLVGRGFDSRVATALSLPLNETDCISCGMCASLCPTGAIIDRQASSKQVPVRELETVSVCQFCSVGCLVKLTHSGSAVLRSLPHAEHEKDALLCARGRFGIHEYAKMKRLTVPLARAGGELGEASLNDAAVLAVKGLQSVAARHGAGAVAVAVSDRYTSEELLLIKEFALKGLKTDKIYSLGRRESGLEAVLGSDASTCSFDELENTSLIVLVCVDIMRPHTVAGFKIRRAAEGGAKLLAINPFDSEVDAIAEKRLDPGEDLSFLTGVLRALIDSGAGKGLPGFDELAESLSGVTVTDGARDAAGMIADAKRCIFVYEENTLTPDAARLVADIAAVTGNIGRARSGVLRLKPNVNSQGLADADILPGGALREAVARGEVRGLFVFGEDADLGSVEFLAAHELFMTDTARRADVVLPARALHESDGTVVNTIGETLRVRKAVDSKVKTGNIETLQILAGLAGHDLSEAGHNSGRAEIKRDVRLRPVANGPLIERARNTNAVFASFSEFLAENRLD